MPIFDPKPPLLRMFTESGAFQRGEFTLASGQKSDVFVDCKKLVMDSRFALRMGTLFCEAITRHYSSPFVLAGVAEGGIPLVSLTLAGAQQVSAGAWRGGWIRKDAKLHGQGGYLMGKLRAGDEVILLEDVVTTGSSAIQAIHRLAESQIKLRAVFALVDRSEGEEHPFEAMGVPFHALLTLDELRRHTAGQ
jgi:orotate phosphoribosyltransferase